MLNALVKKLNGSGDKPEALQGLIEQLERARGEARDKLAELQVRRHQALLDDADDATLNKLERDIARAEVRIEKIDLAIPGIRKRLAFAQSKARDEAEVSLVAEHRVARLKYREALRAAGAARASLDDIDTRACAALGEGRARTTMPPAAYLGHLQAHFIEMWAEIDNRVFPTGAASPPRSSPPHVIPVPAMSTELKQGVRLGLLDGPRPAPRPAIDDREPLADGEVRAVILRSGLELGNIQHRVGDRIRLSRTTAELAARAGALEILQEVP
jgi:hypothetical protein